MLMVTFFIARTSCFTNFVSRARQGLSHEVAPGAAFAAEVGVGAFQPLVDVGQDVKEARTPQAMLALARTYEGLGRNDEAAVAYEWAAPRLPGLEGVARHAAFLARTGRKLSLIHI